jgi:hypothetical protein
MCIDKKIIHELESLTLEYWDESKKDCKNAIRNIYITSNGSRENGLLWREMELAENRLNIPSTGGVLALLVGHSLEPLLQMVFCAKPEKILLLLNNEYGDQLPGHIQGHDVETLISYLHEKGYIDHCPVILNRLDNKKYDLTQDNPASVFSFLRKYLTNQLQEGKQILIDITGGKKSMVAGAFLFAAYAKIDVSYVDFDEYSVEHSRPYGYTCKIDCISNPYERFALREWEEVLRLYKICAFRQAYIVLDSIIRAMDPGYGYKELFNQEQIAAVKTLQKMMELYHLWDNGYHHEALKLWKEKISFKNCDKLLPVAVSTFGHSKWPALYNNKERNSVNEPKELTGNSLLNKLGKFDEEFYERPDLIVTYTCDELARINRLITHKGDYRAAFQRSASLYEVLMRVRVLDLWNAGELEVCCNKDNITFTSDKIEQIEKFSDCLESKVEVVKKELNKMLRSSAWESLRRILRGDNCDVKNFKSYSTSNKGPGERSIRIIKKGNKCIEFNEENICSCSLTGNDFRDLRNKSFHTFPPIPKGIALDAYYNVTASFKDLLDYFWPGLGIPLPVIPELEAVEPLSWQKVCQLCGVNFLPPGPERWNN